MPQISGPLILMTEKPAGITELWVRSKELRAYGDGAVVEDPDAIPVVGGTVTFDCIPGEAVFTLVAAGRPVRAIDVIVPEAEEPLTLAQVLDNSIPHTPAVQYRVGEYAMRAEKAMRDVETVVETTTWGGEHGDQLTVHGETSPRLTGPQGDKGDKGDPGEVSTAQLTTALAGKADLVNGEIPTSQIPAVALTKPMSVTSRAAMLALTAQEGDVAIITTGDDKGSYMLGDGPPVVFESWVELATAPDIPVTSVNGQTGTINLGHADVGAASTNHSHTPASLGAAPAHQEVTGDWPSSGTPGTIYWRAE